MDTTNRSFFVRLATDADIDGCLEIYAPIVRDTSISFEFEPPGRDELARRLLDADHSRLTLVAVNGSQVAGYAYATRFRGRPAYDWTVESSVYVHPDYQRRGVARSLYRALLGGLRIAGYRMVIAGITQPNPASVALHEKLGFMYVGTTKNVGYKFERWHGVGFWELDLGSSCAPEQPTTSDLLVAHAEFQALLAELG